MHDMGGQITADKETAGTVTSDIRNPAKEVSSDGIEIPMIEIGRIYPREEVPPYYPSELERFL